MLLKNRVIWSDNGTLKDISDVMNNHISGTKVIPFVAAQDYLFMGAEAPFNNRWIDVLVANDQVSTLGVDIWTGKQWVAVAEVIDLTTDTATQTKSLAQSGRIAWVPDVNQATWSRDDTANSTGAIITGLSSVKIYGLYWARIRFSADLKLTTELSSITWKFANDEDLYALYPEFISTDAKNRFKNGITTFDQIHFEAAKQVIRDIRGDQIADFEGQLLEWSVLREPSIHKAAELIYLAYGSDWKEEIDIVKNRYRESMKVELFSVDTNANAILETKERQIRTGRLIR